MSDIQDADDLSEYILTVIDYFTKWPEAFALLSKNTEEIEVKLHSLICRFGVMSTIISDQGGEFNSKLIDNLSKKFNIKHVTTSPYHLQSNGMLEKFNSTLKSMLNKTISEHANNWEDYIDITLFAYRTSEHHSTKITPFYALYIKKPILPNEENIAPRPGLENVELSEVIDGLTVTKAEIEKKMEKNIEIAQNRQKNAYDERHKVDEKGLNEGDKVLLKNLRRKKSLCHQSKYLGPYIIVSYSGKGNYKLSDLDGKKVIGPYNQKSLKRYYEKDQDEIVTDDNNNEVSINDENAEPNDNNDELINDESINDEPINVNNEHINDESDGSATDTANEDIHDDYYFVTQNTQVHEIAPTNDGDGSGEYNDFFVNQSTLDETNDLEMSGCFDINIEEMLSPGNNCRPQRKRKIRQSSIYEYF